MIPKVDLVWPIGWFIKSDTCFGIAVMLHVFLYADVYDAFKTLGTKWATIIEHF